MPTYKNGLFIFTRDLRIHDNVGLNEAIATCNNVYTAFFFTPEQVTNNRYKSANAVQFMIESLESLESAIASKGGNLVVLYGKPQDCLAQIFKKTHIDAVFVNQDVTKYSKTRANELGKLCNKEGAEFIQCHDYYLTTPGSITNASGSNYMKFTPYYNKVRELLTRKQIEIPLPKTPRNLRLSRMQLKGEIALPAAMDRFGQGGSPQRLVTGGRDNALQCLNSIKQRVDDYEATRNDLEDQTTQLSAYIKYGNVSIREVYYAFLRKLDKSAAESLIRQLIWRDFYAQVMNSNPEVLYGPMKERYAEIKWDNSSRLLNAWKTGTTGFPIVDAGMRELAATGYMHNRARLIAGSFLPKTLFVNWQKGEEHFAKSLTDYDPASNNGNWQWVAGTGADSQPYFRILNPSLQSKKYDPNATYIKRWVPELSAVPASDIHNWTNTNKKYPDVKYPAPIVDYAAQKKKVLDAYSSV